jgi:hypothetical protein
VNTVQMKFEVESVCVDDVLHFDHIRYNTNNHWIDGKPPDDYQVVNDRTRSSNWISLFKEFHRIDIDLSSPLASWLKGE